MKNYFMLMLLFNILGSHNDTQYLRIFAKQRHEAVVHKNEMNLK